MSRVPNKGVVVLPATSAPLVLHSRFHATQARSIHSLSRKRSRHVSIVTQASGAARAPIGPTRARLARSARKHAAHGALTALSAPRQQVNAPLARKDVCAGSGSLIVTLVPTPLSAYNVMLRLQTAKRLVWVSPWSCCHSSRATGVRTTGRKEYGSASEANTARAAATAPVVPSATVTVRRCALGPSASCASRATC